MTREHLHHQPFACIPYTCVLVTTFKTHWNVQKKGTTLKLVRNTSVRPSSPLCFASSSTGSTTSTIAHGATPTVIVWVTVIIVHVATPVEVVLTPAVATSEAWKWFRLIKCSKLKGWFLKAYQLVR